MWARGQTGKCDWSYKLRLQGNLAALKISDVLSVAPLQIYSKNFGLCAFLFSEQWRYAVGGRCILKNKNKLVE